MSAEPQTIEEYQALLKQLREEAGKRNDGAVTLWTESQSLQAIRKLLHLPRYGLPIQRWESDADGYLYLD